MTPFVTLAVGVLLAIAGVVVLRARVCVGLVMCVQLSLVLLGLLAMLSEGSIPADVVVAFGSGWACLFLGYVLFRRRRKSAETARATRPLAESSVWVLTLVTAGLTAYHFAVAGVPILTDEIERSRFDFSSSGLFGLPGRAYLYGTKIVWVLASVNATAQGKRWVASRPWLAATGVAVGAAILSGFKGQLLTLVVLGCLLYTFAHPDHPLRLARLVVRYAWMPALALGYFFYAASKYRTYDVTGLGGLNLLLERLTGVAAEPAAVALQLGAGAAHPGLFGSDFAYFVSKYTGGDVQGRFTFERAVSAEMSGVSPASSAWTVPTTVGGISESIFAFGPVLGLVALLSAGVLLRWLEVPRARSVLADSGRFIAVFALYTWVMRGGLSYIVLNWLAMVAFMFAMALVTERLAQRRKPLNGARGQDLSRRTVYPPRPLVSLSPVRGVSSSPPVRRPGSVLA